jgi:hypothetical protein
MSKQPRDDGNEAIPVLALRPNRGLQVPFTDTSNTSPQISSSVRVVTLFATQDCFIEIGGSGVEANTSNSHFLSSSIPFDISLGAETNPADNDKFVAVIQASNPGTLHISERD